MKFVFKLVAALIVALATGAGSALLIIDRGARSSDVENGPWRANLTIDSKEEVDPYTRAMVAQADLLALNKNEVLSFTAFTDDTGALLSSACNYKIAGRDLPARWWNLTAYGADEYLIPNPQDRYSFGATHVTRAEDGTYTLYIAPGAQSGDRIPSGKKHQHLSVILRLYNPEQIAVAAPSTIALPTITQEACP